MSSINNGGTAFPSEENQTEGMSLRDYFAAHAPPAPDWWPDTKPALEKRPDPGWPDDKLGRWKGWGDWLQDEDIAADELAEFRAFKAEGLAAAARNAAARLAAEMDTVARWRWFYADGMITTRAKG